MDERGKGVQDQMATGQTLGYAPGVRPGSDAKAPGTRTLQVEVVGGPLDGQRCTVPGSAMTIGRDEDNDLSLKIDRMASARHARIVREGDHFWLEDRNSRNGTFLGDRRIRERTLIGPGTLFTIGRTSLEFDPR